MQTVGIDLGTTFVKTSNEIIFPSGISENVYIGNSVMKVDGKEYAMGLTTHKAILDININKSINRNARLNFIYALFLEGRENDNVYSKVVTALPPSQWKNGDTVEQYKELLSIHEPLSVKVNQYEKTIKVESIDVVPEDAVAYYSLPYMRFMGRSFLLLGWGSLTLNQILFVHDEIVDLHTDEFGVLKVYKDMAEKITTKTGINVRMEDMMEILQFGLTCNGKNIDIEDIVRSIALDYCNMIYKHLKLRWSIDSIPFVQMLGGGSIVMHKYFKELVPHAELCPNPQKIAAIGMGEMAGVVV